MKKFIYTIAAASMMFTSCVKDDNVPEAPVEPPSDLTVVINEVLSTGDPDWFELYNATDAEIDLTGYIVTDKTTDDPEAYKFADGAKLAAGEWLAVEPAFGISSKGDKVDLYDASGTLIDHVEIPKWEDEDAGQTWGRETDANENWIIMPPTKGAANSSENQPPILDASELTEFENIYAVNASDADGIASVKLVLMVNEGVVSIDMALVDGKYRTSVPKGAVGSIVKYYVIAADNTGLTTVYPEGGIETPGEYTVVGGFDGDPSFSEVQDATTLLYNFTVSGVVHYPEQVDEIRVYYVLNDVVHDETVDPPLDTKEKVKVSGEDINADGRFSATIAGLSKDDLVTYYIRVEYNEGTKTYYPIEETDIEDNVTGDFNHDNSATWPNVRVGSIPVAPTNGFSELSVTNEVGADLVFDVKVVDTGVDLDEVRFYYYINFDEVAFLLDPSGYEDANRNKIKAAISADNLYSFPIPAADLATGDLVSWYMRAEDVDGGKVYYTFGKSEEDFDGDIKDDPTTWHVVTKE